MHIVESVSNQIIRFRVLHHHTIIPDQAHYGKLIIPIGGSRGAPLAIAPYKRGNVQGSDSSRKTWKNDNSFSSPGKVLEFYNFIKNSGKNGSEPGKMNCLGKIVLS